MESLQTIKDRIPDYAKDLRLNLDAVINRSSLTPALAAGAAVAAAFAAKSPALVAALQDDSALEPRHREAALTAAALMGMNNVWYHRLLRENGFTTQQLRDVGRIAAVVNAVAQVLVIEQIDATATA